MGRALQQFLSALYNRRNSRQQPPIPPPFQRAGRLCISRRAAFFPPQHFPPILPHHPETRMFQPRVPPPYLASPMCAVSPAQHRISQSCVFPAPPSSRRIPKRVCFSRLSRHSRLAPPMRDMSLTYPPIPPSFQRAGRLCISRRAAFFPPPSVSRPSILPHHPETRMLQPSPAPAAPSSLPCALCLPRSTVSRKAAFFPYHSISRPSSRRIPKRACFNCLSRRRISRRPCALCLPRSAASRIPAHPATLSAGRAALHIPPRRVFPAPAFRAHPPASS